jgi:uncharacterized membrane protein
MKDVSLLEMIGLNPKPISTVVGALFVLVFVLRLRNSVEGLSKGFKHPSVRHGDDVVRWLLILIIALILLAMPLFPATR